MIEKHGHGRRVAGPRVRIQRRFDEAGRDRIHPHAIGRKLGGQRAREPKHRMLRRGIGGRGGLARVEEAMHRRQVDNPPPARAQRRQ